MAHILCYGFVEIWMKWTQHGQEAPSIPTSVLNIEHKWAFTQCLPIRAWWLWKCKPDQALLTHIKLYWSIPNHLVEIGLCSTFCSLQTISKHFYVFTLCLYSSVSIRRQICKTFSISATMTWNQHTIIIQGFYHIPLFTAWQIDWWLLSTCSPLVTNPIHTLHSCRENSGLSVSPQNTSTWGWWDLGPDPWPCDWEPTTPIITFQTSFLMDSKILGGLWEWNDLQKPQQECTGHNITKYGHKES